MGLQIIKTEVLRVCKVPIQSLAGLADHYFLSEINNLNHSLGWGPKGLELRGNVKITNAQLNRVGQFIEVAKYNISINNCEHFANYVIYGLNLSSQQNLWWKSLGANVISKLQLVQGKGENYQSFMREQVLDSLHENLRQARIERANQDRIIFWKDRGIDL